MTSRRTNGQASDRQQWIIRILDLTDRTHQNPPSCIILHSQRNILALTMRNALLSLLAVLLVPSWTLGFLNPIPSHHYKHDSIQPDGTTAAPVATTTSLRQQSDSDGGGEQSIYVDPNLTEERVTELFAFISRALAGDDRYGNIMVAIAAVFGDLPDNSPLKVMLKEAMQSIPPEEQACGFSFSISEREQASLGAMGAAQWTGQWQTRPHALLTVTNMTSVDDWKKNLPRGVKRTLKKALAQNFTVTPKLIRGGEPAPHSSLAHFRCVVEHEVRLLSGYGVEGFFDALAEAVSRYVGTTRMAGEIREYRDANGQVIAFAHEVRKGKTIRGQWFYANDVASKNYVWFHSVHDLVERAIEAEGVDVVDLGPSGSDAFSELKERYGFVSVTDWPAVADYLGPFYYPEGEGIDKESGLLASLFESLNKKRDSP